MLYEQLEQALVNDHINLYKLRRVFTPNAKADPIVVANITFSNITDEVCAGVNIKKSNIVSQNETYSANYMDQFFDFTTKWLTGYFQIWFIFLTQFTVLISVITAQTYFTSNSSLFVMYSFRKPIDWCPKWPY